MTLEILLGFLSLGNYTMVNVNLWGKIFSLCFLSWLFQKRENALILYFPLLHFLSSQLLLLPHIVSLNQNVVFSENHLSSLKFQVLHPTFLSSQKKWNEISLNPSCEFKYDFPCSTSHSNYNFCKISIESNSTST